MLRMAHDQKCFQGQPENSFFFWNKFQAQGVAPFTTTIIGLSPLIAQVVNLVLTFEEVTNFVSISANLTALNSFGIDNIKVQVEDNQGRAGIVPMLFAKKWCEKFIKKL